jgi:hypothetical protein
MGYWKFMKTVSLAAIAVFYAASGGAECISAAARAALLRKIRLATVQIDMPDEEGSGFLLRSTRGIELVTAHHVVDRRKYGEGCADTPSRSLGFRAPRVNFAKGQPRRAVYPKFTDTPEDLSRENDLVKTKLEGLNYAALEALAADQLPGLGEEIVIAGHPAAKHEKYMQHSCKFIGYGDSAESAKMPTYSLRCKSVDYDLAGMSGGVAISACTGKVIGALSTQDFGECNKTGDKTFVSIAPLNQNRDGKIALGLPKATGATLCWYDKNAGAGAARACDVGPGRFPAGAGH